MFQTVPLCSMAIFMEQKAHFVLFQSLPPLLSIFGRKAAQKNFLSFLLMFERMRLQMDLNHNFYIAICVIMCHNMHIFTR